MVDASGAGGRCYTAQTPNFSKGLLMNYVLTFYEVSAVIAALVLLPYVDRFFAIAKASSAASTNQPRDQATALIVMLVTILVPVVNTLFVLHAVDCYFRYPEAK